MELFKSCGFLYAVPLARGTLHEMVNFPLGFDSTIPAILGMPPLPDQTRNIAEGIVIKPLKNVAVESKEGIKRVIFKRKVDGFCERKPRRIAKREQKTFDKNQLDYQLLQYEMLALITEQRAVNVISKLGQPEQKSTSKDPSWEDVLSALISDIVAELKMDDELWEKFIGLPQHLKGSLITKTREECNVIVEEYKEKV